MTSTFNYKNDYKVQIEVMQLYGIVTKSDINYSKIKLTTSSHTLVKICISRKISTIQSPVEILAIFSAKIQIYKCHETFLLIF